MQSAWTVLYFVFGLFGSTMYLHVFHKRYDSGGGGELLSVNVFWISQQCLPGTLIVLRRIQWDIRNAHSSRQILMKLYCSLSCQVWSKMKFSLKIFEKYSDTKFHENPFTGSRVAPYGRTGRQPDSQTGRQAHRHGDASSLYSHFSKAPKNTHGTENYNSVFSQM
jgi:hypothetical protein